MTREQLRDTKDFNSLSRDQLRQEARRHNVRIATTYGSYLPVWDANKDDLVRAFNTARDTGKFGPVSITTGTDSANVSVKTRSVVAFLKGTGCANQATYIAATLDDDVLTIYPELRPEDFEYEDMDDYEKFTTTADDVRALLKALAA